MHCWSLFWYKIFSGFIYFTLSYSTLFSLHVWSIWDFLVELDHWRIHVLKCGGPLAGGLGDGSPSGVQGQSPGTGSGGWSPPEASGCIPFNESNIFTHFATYSVYLIQHLRTVFVTRVTKNMDPLDPCCPKTGGPGPPQLPLWMRLWCEWFWFYFLLVAVFIIGDWSEFCWLFQRSCHCCFRVFRMCVRVIWTMTATRRNYSLWSMQSNVLIQLRVVTASHSQLSLLWTGLAALFWC